MAKQIIVTKLDLEIAKAEGALAAAVLCGHQDEAKRLGEELKALKAKRKAAK